MTDVIHEVTRELIPARSAAERRQRVCDRLVESPPCSVAWIGHYDQVDGRILPEAAAGTTADALAATPLTDDSPRQRAVDAAISSQSVRVERAVTPPTPVDGRHEVGGDGDASDEDSWSVVVVPLVHENEACGVLVLETTHSEWPGEADREALASLGETVAYALADARSASRDELELRERTLRRAYGVITTSDEPFPEKVRSLLGIVREAVGAEHAVVTRRTDDDDRFEVTAATPGAAVQTGETLPLDELPACRRVVESGDVVASSEDGSGSAGGAASIGAPVHVADSLDGTVCFYGRPARPEPYADWEVTFVELLGNWVGRERTRRRREHRLEQYEQIVESVEDGIYALDSDSRFTMVNDAYCEMMGYDREELLGANASLVHTADLSAELSTLVGDDAESETAPVEAELRTADDRRLTVRARVTPFQLADGTYGRVGVVRDVSEYYQMRTELDEIYSRVSDAFYALDEEFRFTYVNDRAEELLQHSEAELLGERLWDYFPEAADVDDVWESFQAAMETQEPQSYDLYFEPLGFWVEATVYPSETGVSAYFRDATEQKERERYLEQYVAVTETASDVVVSIDEQSVIQSVNPAVEDVFGYSRDELVGEPLAVLMPDSMRDRHREAFRRYVRTGERTVDWDYLELPGEHRDGSEIPLSVSFSEYEHEDEKFFTGIIRDISERKEFEQTLANLHDVSRDLVGVETRLDVGERVVDAATDLLDVDGVGVFLFDETENALRPAAASDYLVDTFDGELPTFAPDDTAITWTSFINGETVTHSDLVETEDAYRRDTPVRSGLWIPLADHGVLAILSEHAGGFDVQTERLADHLAATAETALDRVEREASLREQERELESRNQQLRNLNRTNDIIRNIDQALVEATTRESVEQAVCELLVQDERFAFAWIGEGGDGAVTPRTWAGDDQGYLDAVSLTTDGGDPAVQTAASGDTTLVSNVASNLRRDPWRKAALARDLQSAISIPLRYNDVDYGILTVYATRPDAFDELSQSVLRELGETIANAMNFVDTRRALLADTVVELEVTIRDPDSPLARLARDAGCQFEFQGVVPQAAGTARVYVTASGADADTVSTAAEASTRVERATHLGDGDGGGSRFEFVVVGETIPSTLVASGAVVQAATITATDTNVVVELPHSVGVRTFVDRLEERYPDTDLVARRDRERTDQSREGFEAALTDRLTPRQLETLQTAYHSGYFEWPRERTGEEVAANLGITQPTFNGHLRAAERKLCAMLFDGTATPPN